MNPDALIPAAIFIGAFFIGARSTWRLWLTYSAIARVLKPNRRAIGRAFVVVAVSIVVVAGWFGFVTVRRLFGFEALDWSPYVGYFVALPVLLLPAYLEQVWRQIGRSSDPPDDVPDSRATEDE